MTDPQQRRVAVIAVHGVGYTEPCATAKHLADLLLGLGRLKLDQSVGWPGKDKPRYSEFTKQPVIVPLKAPYLAKEGRSGALARVNESKNPVNRGVHVFDERLGYLAQAFRSDDPKLYEKEVRADHGKIAHEFMRSQLAEYVGEENGRAFDTTCMQSERSEEKEGKKTTTTVHVYEAYWADLARPKNSFISFFMAFYQLLFHLSSLSRTAVYYAALEHMSKTRWRVVSFLQAFASRMLVLPIPLLNLIMLLAGLSVLTLKISGDPLPWAVVVGCILGLASILFLRPLRSTPHGPVTWLLMLSLAAAAGGGIVYRFASPRTIKGQASTGANPQAAELTAKEIHHSQQPARYALAIEWWIIGGALLYELFRKYDRVRRSALGTGLFLLAASFILFCYFLGQVNDNVHDIQQASFWTVEVDLAALVLSWALFLASTALLWVSNLLCLFGKKARALPEEERARARAALRTGRLTLAASASVFLLTTVFIWSGIFQYTNNKFHAYQDFKPQPPPIGRFLQKPLWVVVPDQVTVNEWMCRVDYHPEHPDAFGDYVRGLFMIGVTSGLPIMLALTVPALIILVLTVVPSLLVSPDRYYKKPNKLIETMGNWFSHGLDATRAVTSLAWHAIFSVTLFFGALDFLYCNNFDSQIHVPWLWENLAPLTKLTMGMLDAAAATLAVSGAALAAVILKYGKTPLDIILDVDNYLRTSPLDNTPRARIVERYVSLLRLIANRNAEDETPYYHSIVIGAHSLGALISADLLHFLNREGDPELGRLGFAVPKAGEERKVEIPISLLTFGNPLRQLLTRFFPHLYWWVNGMPDNSLGPLPLAAAELNDVRAATTPPLQLLGLARWTSAYRSGDFVGRSVWLHNWYRRNGDGDDKGQPPEPPTVFIPGDGARELCIGIGGHNDYWNRSAPEIAEQLDLLIK